MSRLVLKTVYGILSVVSLFKILKKKHFSYFLHCNSEYIYNLLQHGLYRYILEKLCFHTIYIIIKGYSIERIYSIERTSPNVRQPLPNAPYQQFSIFKTIHTELLTNKPFGFIFHLSASSLASFFIFPWLYPYECYRKK